MPVANRTVRTHCLVKRGMRYEFTPTREDEVRVVVVCGAHRDVYRMDRVEGRYLWQILRKNGYEVF